MRLSAACPRTVAAAKRSRPPHECDQNPHGDRDNCAAGGLGQKNDPLFLPPGAEAFKLDNPNAEVQFYDTGHFVLETHHRVIADAIREFLNRKLTTQVSAA
jgi:hypothetical protein